MRIKLDPGAFMPVRAHSTDAGLDLLTPESVVVPAGGSKCINTGVHVELPPGTVGMLKSKSGLNVRHNLTGEGVIDEGYTGSIVAKLYNHGLSDVVIEKGQKIIQLVIMPIIIPELELVNDLYATERGDGGFGSSGK